MKIRCGFVSNSSSSSFIVATDPGKTKVRMTIEFDLGDLASSIENIKEFKDTIEHTWDVKIDKDYQEGTYENDLKKLFEKAKTLIENGKVIWMGEVSNCGSDLGRTLYNNVPVLKTALNHTEGMIVLRLDE